MKEEWITTREACKLLDVTAAGFGHIRKRHNFQFKVINENYTYPSKLYLKSELVPLINRRRTHTRVDTLTKYKTPHGYVLIKIPSHPNCDAQGTYPEHRYVMEQQIGRFLDRHETVHHKNNKRDDNRPENLVLYKNQGEHLTIAHKLTSEVLAMSRIPGNLEKVEKFIAKLKKENDKKRP